MRFAFIVLSTFAIALSSKLDPYSEAKRFIPIAWEHLKAKNYTIIDPELVVNINGTIYNKENYIKTFEIHEQYPDKVPELNVTHAIFDAKGMLVFDIQTELVMRNTAKPNANIRGGYTLFKFELVQ
ncbi:unnamed protein product [Caenorhabditis angaria]|uniref:Uncharacterized protein n=1 Tax=Caenorhabditis angaria TaxID=860376 RepID=A0A9P1J4K9_9PELO|nr:unnamed protein product [Caenorhabditis angaria]